ncbi:MAG: glycosyltransferase family 4 protein [Anaerolineales bacterium]
MTPLLPTLTFISAFALSALATFAAMRLGERTRLVQLPGGRRQHTRPVARIGGVGLFIGFFVVALGLYLFAPLKDEHRQPLIGVLVGTVFVFLGGMWDDVRELKAGPQFAIQFGAAAIALLGTVWIGEVTLPFYGVWQIPLLVRIFITISWVMGMMNTVNFLDGLDGLAAGVAGIAALLFAIHSTRLQQPEIALYSIALAGACVGFLIFNIHPARVFLGSAGAMVLGYALATLSILAPARVATALLVMALPIADVFFQIVDRWRRGQSPMQGDRGHLHFRLSDFGLPQWPIVLGYWLFCALGGVIALAPIAPEVKLAAIAGVGVLVVIVLLVISRRK